MPSLKKIKYISKLTTVTLSVASMSLSEPYQLPDRYFTYTPNRDEREVRCFTLQQLTFSAPPKKCLIRNVIDEDFLK